jgi:hypothetical protein
LGVRRVRIFRNRPSAQQVRNVFGQIQPAKPCRNARSAVGVQLKQRIQADDLYSGQLVKFPARDEPAHFPHGPGGPLIPVAKRIADPLAVPAEPHIVNRPAIDSDRRDSFRGLLRTLPQARFDAGENSRDIPTQAGF